MMMDDPDNKKDEQTESGIENFDDGFESEFDDFDDFDVNLEEEDVDFTDDDDIDVGDIDLEDDFDDVNLDDSISSEASQSEVINTDDLDAKDEASLDTDFDDGLDDFDAPIEDDFALDDGFDEDASEFDAGENQSGGNSVPPIGGVVGQKKSGLFNLAVFGVFAIVGLGFAYFQFFSGSSSEAPVVQTTNVPATQNIQNVPDDLAQVENTDTQVNVTDTTEEDLSDLFGEPPVAENSSPEGVTDTESVPEDNNIEGLDNDDVLAELDSIDAPGIAFPSPEVVDGDVSAPDDLGLENAPVLEEAPAPEPIIEDVDVSLPTSVDEDLNQIPDVVSFEGNVAQPSVVEGNEPISGDAQLLSDIRNELQDLNSRVQGLEGKVRNNAQKINDSSLNEGILSAIRALEEKVSNLAPNQSGTSPKNVSPIKDTVDVRQPRAVPPSEDTITVRPIKRPNVPQQKPQTRVAQQLEQQQQKPRSSSWVLRAAQPGKAWVSPIGSQEIKTISVGDRFDQYGEVIFIGRSTTGWVVQGTNGVLAQ